MPSNIDDILSTYFDTIQFNNNIIYFQIVKRDHKRGLTSDTVAVTEAGRKTMKCNKLQVLKQNHFYWLEKPYFNRDIPCLK